MCAWLHTAGRTTLRVARAHARPAPQLSRGCDCTLALGRLWLAFCRSSLRPCRARVRAQEAFYNCSSLSSVSIPSSVTSIGDVRMASHGGAHHSRRGTRACMPSAPALSRARLHACAWALVACVPPLKLAAVSGSFACAVRLQRLLELEQRVDPVVGDEHRLCAHDLTRRVAPLSAWHARMHAQRASFLAGATARLRLGACGLRSAARACGRVGLVCVRRGPSTTARA